MVWPYGNCDNHVNLLMISILPYNDYIMCVNMCLSHVANYVCELFNYVNGQKYFVHYYGGQA